MEFFLAAELGWGSVAALRAGMSSEEFCRWGIYYARKAQRRQVEQ